MARARLGRGDELSSSICRPPPRCPACSTVGLYRDRHCDRLQHESAVLDRVRRFGARAHRAVRLGRRLSRRNWRQTPGAAGVDARSVARAVRRAGVRRHGPGAGARVRAAGRRRLDRQEHLPHQFRSRIVVVPRRNPMQPAARHRLSGARSMRHVHAVPRGVPDAGAGGSRRTRFDALRVVPHD